MKMNEDQVQREAERLRVDELTRAQVVEAAFYGDHVLPSQYNRRKAKHWRDARKRGHEAES